jgi:hypothetical protein
MELGCNLKQAKPPPAGAWLPRPAALPQGCAVTNTLLWDGCQSLWHATSERCTASAPCNMPRSPTSS